MLQPTILVILFGTCFSLQSWQVNEGITNKAVYGDMLLTPRQQQRYGGSTSPVRGVYKKESLVNRWTDNVVPYMLSPQYTEQQKSVVRSSLQDLESKTCFRFVERVRERDFLFIVPLDGCYSYVGKIGGRQLMSLAPDCLANYIIWHEVMHAIGFEHEHQRPDRDNFIKVEYANVQPGQMVNFEKISSYEVDYPDTYDYKSIMHYDGFAFGRREGFRRLATMIPLKSGVTLDDNMNMSNADLIKLNRLGKCSASSNQAEQSAALLPGVGCVDQNENCRTMTQKGLCKMGFYRATMERQCRRSCGLCPAQAVPANSLSSSNTVTCADQKVDCSKFVTQCGLPQYERMMVLLCPVTCGLCEKRKLMPACVDTDPNCAIYETNGFCTDHFYDGVRETRCAKTCGLC